MRAFLSKYLYLLIWIAVIAVIGAIFVYVVQSNLHLISSAPAPVAPQAASAGAGAPPTPPAPSVTLTIEVSKTGNSLFVEWANLPGNTTELEIFRGKANSTSSWSLWKTLIIGAGDLGGGNATIGLGNSDLNGYSFYVEAVNNGGGGGNGSSTSVIWTSPTGEPGTTTSTQAQATSTNGGGGGQNGSGAASTTSSSTSSSTGQTQVPPPPENPTSSNSVPSSTTPTGTPYYNPQIQIETYGSGQTGNFWVQHVDQKIQIGWQNLPPETTSIIVLRSENETGPWTTVLSQQDPDLNDPSSIQVVDDTLGQPYYYEMSALSASTTLATYGPVYLAAAGQ